MTDQDLQLFLANMLPEKKIRHIPSAEVYEFSFMWSPEGFERGLLDTEWLQVCYEIRSTLTLSERVEYLNTLRSMLGQRGISDFDLIQANWRQQAAALIKVKGDPK